MKKFSYILMLGLLSAVFFSCSEDDDVTASKEDLFPKRTTSEIDKIHHEMFGDFNTRIEYRYIKNYIPSDWYYITPVKEELVLPMSNIVMDYWINPLIAGSSREFVAMTFPKLLVYIGSPAYQEDGSKVMGEAEGGTIIRFTEVNAVDVNDDTWRTTQLHTAYHEYAHIIHQRNGFPNEYREITPNSYVKSGWMTVSESLALKKGMVTPYATSGVQEDFVELFSTYVVHSQEELDHFFVDVVPEEGKSLTQDQIETNQGRAILRQKLSVQKKYMKNAGLDMDVIRASYQALLVDKK